MVKAKAVKNGDPSGYATMEKTMKKKKRKAPSGEKDSDLNLVPSVVDPSLEVHVPVDHRVNLAGVLDDSMLSKVHEWGGVDPTSGTKKAADDEVLLDVAADIVTRSVSSAKSKVKSSAKVKSLDNVASPPPAGVTGDPSSSGMVDAELEALPVPEAPCQAGVRALDCSSALSCPTPASGKKDPSPIDRVGSGSGEAPPMVFVTAADQSTGTEAVKGAAKMKGQKHIKRRDCSPIVCMGSGSGEAPSMVFVAAADQPTGSEAVKGAEKLKSRKHAKRPDCSAQVPVKGVSFGSFNGLSDSSAANPGTDQRKTSENVQSGASHQPVPPNGGKTNVNFAGLFKENRVESNGLKLQFHDFMEGEVVLDESDEIPVVEAWGLCLIGCFTGSFPGRPALDAIVKQWGVKCRVLPYGKGWTVFRFLNEEDRLHVLHGGPYMAFGKTLMLKLVDDGVLLTDDLFMKVPTWVLLHDVPLSVWSESGLSKISSKVGTPLFTDKVTKDRSKMNYARCLVEVDVSKPPVSEFCVRMSGDRRYTQKVSYEHFPSYCCDCKIFGHNIFKCPAKLQAEGSAGDLASPSGTKQAAATMPPAPRRGPPVKSKGKAPKGKAPMPTTQAQGSRPETNANQSDVLRRKATNDATVEPGVSQSTIIKDADMGDTAISEVVEAVGTIRGSTDNDVLMGDTERTVASILTEQEGTWLQVVKKGTSRRGGVKSSSASP